MGYNNCCCNCCHCCDCHCHCHHDGGGDTPPTPPSPPQSRRLLPNIDGCFICLDTDPKQLVISGTNGKPGGHVHVHLTSNETGFSLLYPEKDSEENLVDEDGGWTTILRLDANTKNVSGIASGKYFATFTQTDEDGEDVPHKLNRMWICLSQCEKAELQLNHQANGTIMCEDGKVTFRGTGSAPNADINIYLFIGETESHFKLWNAGKADASGQWACSINSASLDFGLGTACIPTGLYKVVAFQTNADGFLRESIKLPIVIDGCCPPVRNTENASPPRDQYEYLYVE